MPITPEIPGRTQRLRSGSISRQEKLGIVVFVEAAATWISRGFVLLALVPGIDDAVIALAGAALIATGLIALVERRIRRE